MSLDIKQSIGVFFWNMMKAETQQTQPSIVLYQNGNSNVYVSVFTITTRPSGWHRRLWQNYSDVQLAIYLSIWKRTILKENWIRIQLPRKTRQLPPTAKTTWLHSIISTPLSMSASVSTHIRRQCSASELPRHWRNILKKKKVTKYNHKDFHTLIRTIRFVLFGTMNTITGGSRFSTLWELSTNGTTTRRTATIGNTSRQK